MIKVICSIIKNERKDVKEWVDYHLNLGFDKIYLYEDYGSESHKDIFKDNPAVSVMTVKEFGIPRYKGCGRIQFTLLCNFLELAKKNKSCDWILFNDVDEFLMFEEGYNLDRLLEEYKNKPAIWLCWKMYGANGHIKRPEGGILKNYTKPGGRCDAPNKWNFKSLVNVALCKGMFNVHEAMYGEKTNGDNNPETMITYEKAWLNHYYSKSWEDYVERMCSRGNMGNNNRSFDNFFYNNPDMRDKMKELIESVRCKHTVGTHWISKELGLISGGNIDRIRYLQLKYSDRINNL